MDDVGRVEGPDDLRKLRCDLEELLDGEGPGAGPPSQRRVPRVIHDESEAPVGRCDLVHLDDAGDVHRTQNLVLVAQGGNRVGVPTAGSELLHDQPAPVTVTAIELMPKPLMDELALR